jgi:hypothetical protein
VAVHDHPAFVRAVLEQTGASQLQVVVHCQGSTSPPLGWRPGARAPALHLIAGYTHMDMLFGRHAVRGVYARIVRDLAH